jgi:hypothetical protein
MTAGQVSDYSGAAALLSSLPSAHWLFADRGYDADWFRDALKDAGIMPCIPGRKSRAKPSNTTSPAANAAAGSRSWGADASGGVVLDLATGVPEHPPSVGGLGNFARSCFHNPSTKGAKENAASEGRGQASDKP